MDIKELEELYLTRQSCRKYDVNKKVDTQTLKKITELATLSPSACNSQPWRFISVNKAETVREIAKATQLFGMNKFTDNCTAFAVLTETPANLTEKVGKNLTDRDFIANDLGIACAHFVLAAQVAGVSTCILGMFDEKALKTILNIPEKHRPRLVIAMGYAAQDDKIRPKNRKTSEVTCEFVVD